MPVEPHQTYMSSQLTVKAVERYDDRYDVQFRDADEFDELETPDWARELAQSEVPESDVQMGRDDTADWRIQSVRVPVTQVDGEAAASRRALEVVTLINDHEIFDSR